MSPDPRQRWLRDKLRHIAFEAGELPGIRLLARPLHARRLARPHRLGNTYHGVHATFADALAAAPAALPSSYDIAPALEMYGERSRRISVSDYPVVYWLARLLGDGATRVFDLGGHLGISYRAFQGWIDYPAALRWTVHDVPMVVAAGRAMVDADPALAALAFADAPGDADGHDILMANGALQYLDYTLPELLSGLAAPPRHVLVNLTPMHPRLDYVTLQNIGKAVLPYRVPREDAFVDAMAAAGYAVLDRWRSQERSLRIPFHPEHRVDGYCGFCFVAADRGQQKTGVPARAG